MTTIGGYPSAFQYDYGSMVAHKRNQETYWRSDDPEIAARIRSAETHLNGGISNRGQNLPETYSPGFVRQQQPVVRQQQSVAPQPMHVDQALRVAKLREQQAYQQDLQQQVEEQRRKRLRDREAYGALNDLPPWQRSTSQVMQMQQSQSGNDLPPWLRGNPQPKNGIRGSSQWKDSDTSHTALRRERSLPPDFRFGNPNATVPLQTSYNTAAGTALQPLSFNTYTNSNFQNNVDPTNTFGSTMARNQNQSNQRKQDISYRDELAKQIQQKQQEQAQRKLEEQRHQELLEKDADIYSPYGKGGAGAPMRDENGRVITDRRKLHRSWNSQPSKQLANQELDVISLKASRNEMSTKPIYGSSGLYSYASTPNLLGGGTSEKQSYKEALRAQIEENQAQRARAKEQEKADDDRHRQQFLEYQRKQQAELDAEKEKHKRKQEEARLRQERNANVTTNAGSNRAKPGNKGTSKRDANDGLEWWERKNQPASDQSAQHQHHSSGNRRSQSVSGNDAENYNNSDGTDSPSVDNRQRPVIGSPRGVHLTSRNIMSGTPRRKDVKPTSAAVRNEGMLRQLSAMRERLQKEHRRVQSALRRKEYDEHIFDDDPDILPSAGVLLREEDKVDTFLHEYRQNEMLPPSYKYKSDASQNAKQSRESYFPTDMPTARSVQKPRSIQQSGNRSAASNEETRVNNTYGHNLNHRRFSLDSTDTMSPDDIVDDYLASRQQKNRNRL